MARGTKLSQTSEGGSAIVDPTYVFTAGGTETEAYIYVSGRDGAPPLRLEAYDLPIGVSITFERVQFERGVSASQVGCCIKAGSHGTVRSARAYVTPYGCSPVLNSANGEMWLYRSGTYRLTWNGAVGTGYVVQYEDFNAPPEIKETSCPVGLI